MRTLLLLLLAPFGAFAQPTPYYLAGGLNDFSDQMIRGSNPVYVTLFSKDSLIISTSGEAFEHSSAYRRSPGEGFLRRTRQWGTSMANFVFLYEKGIFLVEEGGSYLVFLKDKNAADQMLAAGDKSYLLHMKDSLRRVVAEINSRQQSAANKAAEVRNRAIVTAYIHGIHSRRDDPALASAIKKWSGNTTTTVYIVDADYYITRNYRGEVLNKNIPALIKYHLNGKCYVQWRAFGYEALGGGSFGKDLYTYNKSDYYIQATGAGGSLRLEPGIAYQIDCE